MRQPDKKRYLDAVAHVEREDVSFFEPEVDITIVEKILGCRFDRNLRSYTLPADKYAEFYSKTGMDMAYLAVPWKLGRKEVMDSEGRLHYVDGTIKTFSDIKTIKDPGVDHIRKRIEEVLDALKDTKLGIVYNLFNTPAIVTTAVGYQDYYMSLLTQPDFIRECFKRVEEITVRTLETVLNYPIDVLMVAHILCMNTGPIMSREIMEEYEFPYLRRHIKSAKEKGMIVCYHADGNNNQLFPDLIDMGIQVFHAIESCGGTQDIYELKKLYGDKITLHGNIDVGEVLMNGTREQVASDVVEHIERLGRGGGYVCASSHDISEKVPLENFWAMVETAHTTKVKFKRRLHRLHD